MADARAARGRARRIGGAVCGVLLGLGTGSARAASDASGALSPPAYQAEIAAAQGAVAACGSSSSACSAKAMPPDGSARAANGAVFRVNWQWLRDTLSDAKGASPTERASQMRAAADHLAELAAESGTTAQAGGEPDFAQSRRAANAILARAEFQSDTGPSWLDRQIARLQDWLQRLLMGLNRVGERNPWLAPLIEWSCFLLAAGGLTYFIRRSLARQALRIALGEGAAPAQSDGRDATDWAQLADGQAAAGDWREAIHSLYWAAITALENRRAWRPNPTRTPREYLGLLRAGSEPQRALRSLTRSLERVWYGYGEATEAEFRSAQASFSAIGAADLKRSSTDERAAGATASTVGAA